MARCKMGRIPRWFTCALEKLFAWRSHALYLATECKSIFSSPLFKGGLREN